MEPDQAFQGEAFSRVFTQSAEASPNEWRLRGSGVQGQPEWSPTIDAVATACAALGIEVERRSSGSAANCDAYYLDASFLDGGFSAKTGNYWYDSRGAWVTGPKAVLLLALHLGLKVRPSWRRRYELESASLEALRAELLDSSGRPS